MFHGRRTTALALLLCLPVTARATSFLVVVLDDLGVDKLGAYADEVYGEHAPTYLPDTPVLDGLAAAGVRFTDVYASPVCSPTRASLLTGRHPFRHDLGHIVVEGANELSTDERTLAEALSDTTFVAAPYATGAFGKWHLGSRSEGGTDWSVAGVYGDHPNPLRHGFAAYDGSLVGSVADHHAWTRTRDLGPSGAEVAPSTEWATDATQVQAVDWMVAQTGDFFAWVAPNAPHTDDTGVRNAYEADDLPADRACVDLDGNGTCGAPEVYAALVSATDERIGRILDELQAADPALMEDLVVVVVGDNGTPANVLEGPFLASGERTAAGKATAYESGVRVPLLLARGCDWMDAADGALDGAYADGTPACAATDVALDAPGRAVNAPVRVTDLFATVAELAGASVPAPEDSVSLVPCLTSADADTCGVAALTGRPLYAETFKRTVTATNNNGTTGVASSGELAVRLGDHKLVARVQGSAASRTTCLKVEQYDLSVDPYETNDLRAGGDTRTLAQSAAYTSLNAWLRSTLAPDWLPARACS